LISIFIARVFGLEFFSLSLLWGWSSWT